MRVLFVGAISALVCACAPNVEVRYGWSQLAPLPYQANGQVQTAQEGQIVFSQEATAANFALLREPFSHVQELPAANATITVSTTSPLYELTGSRSFRGRLFCTLDDTSHFERTRPARSNFMVTVDPAQTWSAQTCFVDDNRDGQFEEITWINGHVNGGPGFGGMMVLKYEIGPIGYGSSPTRDPRTSILGIQYESGGLRVVGILPNGRTNPRPNGPYLPTADRVSIPRALPATLTLQGARIEVLSRANDTITYRVLSGFPTDPPIDTMLLPQ